MPVTARDGRRVGARQNGYGYISVLDDRRNCFVFDHKKAEKLADALDVLEPCSVSTNHAQVLELRVAPISVGAEGAVPELVGRRLLLGEHRHEPHGKPQQPTGPWELSVDQCRQLAEEIRGLLPRAA